MTKHDHTANFLFHNPLSFQMEFENLMGMRLDVAKKLINQKQSEDNCKSCSLCKATHDKPTIDKPCT